MNAASIILAVALVGVSAYFVLLKRDIRAIRRRLEFIRKTDTNAKITTQTLDADVSELANQINTCLEVQKKAELAGEQMSRELKQAITNVSHDLKTPLTSAMGYLQLVRSNKTLPEKKAEYLDIIEIRLSALNSLLEELFEFSKLYEGEEERQLTKVNVSNVLRDALSLYYEDFTRREITPSVHLPDEPVYIRADVNMLRRIFQNLIQNALVHGGGYFSATVEPGAKLIFENSMTDPQEMDASRLFERFYTADLSRKGKTTGLGLAICKELVAKLDGTIQARVERDSLIITIEINEIE